MSTGPAGGPYHTSEDEQILHRMGYAQELFRAMGGFQNFAISFTIISILAGCLTSYYVAFERGGPVAVTWGWLLVGLMSTLIALAMAEIASAYPTAGGLYYWASKLGSPGWGWVDRLVQPHRSDRRHRVDRLRTGHLRHRAVRLWFDYPSTRATVRDGLQRLRLHAVRDLHDRGLSDQRVRHPHHGGAQHDLRLLAHGRRGVHRARPDHRPRQPPVVRATCSARRSTTPGTSRRRQFREPGVLVRVRPRAAASPSTRSPASTHPRTWRRRPTQASRMAAVGMYMSVVVSVVFGWVLLLAVTFAIPTRRARSTHRRDRTVDLDGVDEPELGRDPALHLLSSRSSSASPRRSRRRRG